MQRKRDACSSPAAADDRISPQSGATPNTKCDRMRQQAYHACEYCVLPSGLCHEYQLHDAASMACLSIKISCHVYSCVVIGRTTKLRTSKALASQTRWWWWYVPLVRYSFGRIFSTLNYTSFTMAFTLYYIIIIIILLIYIYIIIYHLGILIFILLFFYIIII